MDSMKKFISILLCFQFLVFPVSFTYAEDLPVPDGVEDEVAQDPFAANASTGEADGGYDFYFRQILVLSLSILGSNLFTQCVGFWKTPSLDVFIAASALFILHEMTDGKDQFERRNKAYDSLKVKDKNIATSGSDLQKDALETALENERNLKEYIVKKRNWAIALEVALLAATGVAIAEEFYSMTAASTAAAGACVVNETVLACKAAATSAAVASFGTGAVASAAAIAACYASCNVFAANGTTAVHAAYSPPIPTAVGATACTLTPPSPYFKECGLHLETYLKAGSAECSALLIPEHEVLTALLTAGITAVWGLGAGQSDGGWINEGGMVLYGALGFILSFTNKSFLPLISVLYNLPIPRSVSFGAQAALMGVILGGLIHREVVVSENITKLRTVINDFILKTEDTDPSSSSDSDLSGLKQLNQGVLKSTQSISLNSNQTCMGADSSIGSKACSNPRKFNKPKFEFGDLGALSSASNLAVDAANSLASGNSAAASASAEQLASMAGRVRKATNDLKKKLNDLRNANGEKSIDFDGEIKKQLTQFEGIMNKAVAAKGLPLLGQPTAGLATLDAEIPKAALAVAAPVAAPAKAADKKPVFDFGLDDEETPQDGGALGDVAKTGEGIDQFDANVADISNKTDVSIFVQLSNRYLLNYTKIFKKVEEKPKVETPKKEEGAKK
jgi:hypothetical protein